jgi:hypothetical protein
MKVIEIKEKEDGSADLTLDLTDEEARLLIEYAVIDILEKALEKQSNL